MPESTSRRIEAHVRPDRTHPQRFRVSCGAVDVLGRGCNALLGDIVREPDLLDLLATGTDPQAIRAAYAKEDGAKHGAPAPVSGWRLYPPPADPRDPASDRAYTRLADNVYRPVGPDKRSALRGTRSRRAAPAHLAGTRFAGHYPEPPIVIVCPRCKRRNWVKEPCIE